jgi:hypothetical protein
MIKYFVYVLSGIYSLSSIEQATGYNIYQIMRVKPFIGAMLMWKHILGIVWKNTIITLRDINKYGLVIKILCRDS